MTVNFYICEDYTGSNPLYKQNVTVFKYIEFNEIELPETDIKILLGEYGLFDF